MGKVGDGFARGLGFAVGLAIGSVFMLAMFGILAVGFGIGVGAGVAQVGITSGTGDYMYLSGNRSSSNRLLTIRIEGVILGTPPRDLPAQVLQGAATYGYVVRRALDDAAKESTVKGVLLHLQTPGGTIFGARAIYDGVRNYRQTTRRPVIAFIEGLSASGGVMAMVGADRIYADYGSLIGSIGVLGPQLYFFSKPIAVDGGLLAGGITTRDGIEQTIVTAGRGKDLGNPFRRPTEEEVSVLQAGVNAAYAHFVAHVATNRKISEATIRDRMGAHIFDNDMAQQFGLIDGTLDRNAAIKRLADMARVGTDYQVVKPKYEQQSFLGQILNIALPRWMGTAQASPNPEYRELCQLAETGTLAYHGDLRALCR